MHELWRDSEGAKNGDLWGVQWSWRSRWPELTKVISDDANGHKCPPKSLVTDHFKRYRETDPKSEVHIWWGTNHLRHAQTSKTTTIKIKFFKQNRTNKVIILKMKNWWNRWRQSYTLWTDQRLPRSGFQFRDRNCPDPSLNIDTDTETMNLQWK